jgi:putative ABC transport system permease protein
MFSDLLIRLRALFRREAVENELDDELRFHFEQQVEKFVRSGMSLPEARRRARLEFGGADQIKEECREARGTHFLETLVQDVRYALRALRKSPGFTTIAVLTLTLGIGANTAIFSAVNPILFEPLPYPHPNRIMMVWDISDGARSEVTFHTYREIAERNRSFDALAISEGWQPTISGQAEPERLDGVSVSADYFRALGVRPAMGRDFELSDNAYHGPNVTILSYGLWQRRFGGDRSIIGRQIVLDGDAYTIVGVMPRGFENVLTSKAEIWSPEQYDPAHIADVNTQEWGHHLRMVGRLRPGVTRAQAKSDLDRIAQTPTAEFPRAQWAALKFGFILDSLQDDIARSVKPAILAVLGAVILVLMIACVNVTNLLLARGAQRRGEFALRAALGAGRARMIRQLLTESLVLAAFGGAFGLLVAQFGVQALVALSPPELPRLAAISIDRNVFIFALAVATLIGLIVGLIPALQASRSNLNAVVNEGSRQAAGGHALTRRSLVVAEVALALVLLVSAGLLLHSLTRLFAVDRGFDAKNLLTMQVQSSGHQFDNDGARHRFFAQALQQVRHVPGVESAAFTSLLPLSDDTPFGSYGIDFEKDKGTDGIDSVYRYVVTPDYFHTMRIPLRRGRYIDQRDVAGAPLSVVISESVAKQEFGNQDPIGQRARIGGPRPSWPWHTVVGVVGDVKQASLGASDPNAVYIAPEQSWFADDAMSIVIRGRGDSAALVRPVQQAIWSVNKDQAIARIATMDRLLASTAAERKFVLVLFAAFGLIALALAAVGIYGVLSGGVTERTREIGIRLALGAPRGNILSLVLRQGMTLTALGLLFGLGGSVLASQAIASLLFGISRLDVITYCGMIALLAAVSAIACWIPARRAMRVDPIVALRHE